jgi:myo-inositol-1(or 4)-monophosphatase
VTCEGRTPIDRGSGTLAVFIDPLDGSLDYKTGRGTFALPYSATVAVFDDATELRFRDCVIAGTIDLRTGDLLLAERGAGCTLNGKTCRTNGATRVDLRTGITIAEFYYPGHRRLVVELFHGEAGYLRSIGSAAFEMALVAGGIADAFCCDQQKNHELGAGYRLVVEAGGAAVDHDGQDLGDRPYVFMRQTPVVLAATRALADELVSRIQRVRALQE